ncbi:MAG: hypothetical protein DCF20_07325 [Pseudanabaena sp.]|nr:MAG: hypothetical protein DCF20_07325 [Pseudanabaena sp.]
MILKDDFITTSGVLALSNLQAQIEGIQARVQAGLGSVTNRSELIELVSLRGLILGQITDYQWTEKQSEHLVCEFPTESLAFIARARTRATFHRFTEALMDLDEAQQYGAEPQAVDIERAGIFQAIGEYDQAIALFRTATERQADFVSLSALAALHAEFGDTTIAEQFFEQSQHSYRGASPIPLALIEFQRGHMWMSTGDLHCAHHWFRIAHRRLPGYAPAQGHLAEVEAEFGETETAINRLMPLTISSDDPDYCVALSRILLKIGRTAESNAWSTKAAARYNDLISRHPEAFADHAAAFWLEVGSDPARALSLAKLNLKIRQTPKAKKLFDRATHACARVDS